MINSFIKLKDSLSKSRNNFFSKIYNIFNLEKNDNRLILEHLEEVLISSDVGASLSEKIIDSVREMQFENSEALIQHIKLNLKKILSSKSDLNIDSQNKPQIIVLIGINGSGKTTTIGKLAYFYKNQSKDILLIPGDTFRAASFEQLNIWSSKVKVEIFDKYNGDDPGAVIFQGLNYALKFNKQFILIDTAGRLQNKTNLMSELVKINNVIMKFSNKFVINYYLILDANSGQNAINQATEFNKCMPLNGLILTKLDGSAKGGIIFRIVEELKIPIKFIGIGEAVNDIEKFNLDNFIESFIESR